MHRLRLIWNTMLVADRVLSLLYCLRIQTMLMLAPGMAVQGACSATIQMQSTHAMRKECLHGCGTIHADAGARLCRCLQQHTSDTDMSTECKEFVEEDERRSSQDYRLNFKLREACKADADNLCGNLCEAHQACGGQVLSCLTEKRSQLESKQCQEEVFYFEKMEVSDFRNDVLLAEACRQDVDSYCRSKKPGSDHVLVVYLPCTGMALAQPPWCTGLQCCQERTNWYLV